MKRPQVPAMEEKTKEKISVRIPKELGERWAFAIANSCRDEPVAVRSLVEAYCDYVDAHGNVTFPLAVSPVVRMRSTAPTVSSPLQTGNADSAGIAADILAQPDRNAGRPRP